MDCLSFVNFKAQQIGREAKMNEPLDIIYMVSLDRYNEFKVEIQSLKIHFLNRGQKEITSYYRQQSNRLEGKYYL